MHEKWIPVLPKSTNIVTLPDVKLYDEQNKKTINEYRNIITDIISPINNH